MNIPDNAIGSQTVERNRVKDFILALVENGGEAKMETILMEITDLSDKELEAIQTLVESEATEFQKEGNLIRTAVEEASKEYQPVIRMAQDNGWLDSYRRNGEFFFKLTERGYSELQIE